MHFYLITENQKKILNEYYNSYRNQVYSHMGNGQVLNQEYSNSMHINHSDIYSLCIKVQTALQQ